MQKDCIVVLFICNNKDHKNMTMKEFLLAIILFTGITMSAQTNIYRYNSYGVKEKVGTVENNSYYKW